MRLLLFACLFFLTVRPARAQRFVRADSLRPGAYGAAAWGDCDGDGRPDLAYGAQSAQAGQSDFLTVYRNTPAGLVAITPALPYHSNPALCWADLDNDGASELLVSGMNGTGGGITTVYHYAGVSGLVPVAAAHLPGFSSGSTAAADYNGDGWKDLAMMGYDSAGHLRAAVLKGGPGFTFTPVSAPVVGAEGGELKWGDFNGDGRPDLLVNGYAANAGDSRIWLYQNMGADSFRLHTAFPRGSLGTVDWLDYDGDGRLDFLVTGVDTTGAHLLADLYHNDGGGAFSLPVTNLPGFGEPSAVAVGDFNQDGKPDLALGGGTDFNTAYSVLAYGTGTATFALDTLYGMDLQNCIAETADFDGDGYPDLLFANTLLRNRGVTASVAPRALPGSAVQVSPNPVREWPVEVAWTAAAAGTTVLTVQTAAGGTVYQQRVTVKAGANRAVLHWEDLAPGLYLLRVGSGEAVRVVKR